MCVCVCCVNHCTAPAAARLAIGDLGTQYFADRGIFCAGRVQDEDLQRVAKATGESRRSRLSGCRQTTQQIWH